MSNAIYPLAVPINEPVRSYAPDNLFERLTPDGSTNIYVVDAYKHVALVMVRQLRHEDDREQAERRHEFAEHLRRAGANVARGEEHRKLEHHMRRRDSRKGADHLRDQVHGNVAPPKTTL